MKKITKIEMFFMKIQAFFLERKIKNDPSVKNATLPPEVSEKILVEIHQRQEQWEMLSEKQKELIYLGQVYKRQQRRRKYWVLVTAVILALAVGMTSFGGVDRMIHKISSMISNRTRETIDTEGVKIWTKAAEEEIYLEIENTYGFHPVRLEYRPIGSRFLEANILNEMPAFSMIYGSGDIVKMVYTIVPNYRNGSWTKDIEDKLMEEYVEEIGDVSIEVKKYLIEDNGSIRWLIQFLYDGNYYSMYIFDVEKEEIDKIISNLIFS